MQRRAIVGFAIVALVVVLLYLLRDVLLPFVAGLTLAYLLDPLADRLQRFRLSRLAATLIILAAFVVGLVLMLIIIVPLAAGQISALIGSLPAMVSRIQAIIADRAGPLMQHFGGAKALEDLQSSVGDLVGQGGSWLLAFLRSIWSGGQAVIGIVSLLVVTPVVAFYLLVDWDRLVETLDRWVPPRHRTVVRELAREIDRAISGFLWGQSLVCLILGAFYAVGLWAIGLNFGVLIGLLSGLLTFIPYVGSLTGLILSLGIAMVQFWPDYTWILATAGIYLTGQFLEGNVISPKLVGESVGLHPVWLIFALLAFGSLFGFLGLLLAVPIAASIGVIARFAVRRYLESSLYYGDKPRLVGADVETAAIGVAREPHA